MQQLEFSFSCDPPKSPEKPALRCRHCKHLVRHQYNENLKYCELQRQRGTALGLKKIKSNDAACHKFEAIEKQ